MENDPSTFAHQYNLLADEQYGKLHGAAIHFATNKCLIYDILRQMKHPMAMCLSDARPCYDRIVRGGISGSSKTRNF